MSIIGIDLGYGYTKALTAGREVRMPSVIGPAVTIRYQDDVLRRNGHGHTYSVDQVDYFTGEWAQLQSPFVNGPRARERTGTDITKTLLISALTDLEIADANVKVVTGLPVEWYADRLFVERQLLATHEYGVDGELRRVTVTDLHIVPQPVGSFFYAILDDEGRLINPDLARGRVAVVDIGMYTTDYLLVDGLRYVDKDSGSIDVGMGRVYDLVGKDILNGYGVVMDVHQVDRAMREGSFKVNGQKLNLADIAAPALHAVADSIIGRARELWGNARDLDKIMLTGGGAIPLITHFTDIYPHIMSMPDPDMANVRGFYRRGLRLWNNG